MGGLCAPSSRSSAAPCGRPRRRRARRRGRDRRRHGARRRAPPPRRPPPRPPHRKAARQSAEPTDISEHLQARLAGRRVRRRPARRATGSGFVYDNEGHIVTNDHVVEAANSFRCASAPTRRSIPAQLVGKDPSSDLAVLKVDPSQVQGGLKPLELGDSTTLQPGDQAIAIGSPFGLEGTVTTGIISSLGRTIDAPNGFPIADAVQTDAAINPGNSGGPLLDGNGRVVGVNSQIKSGSDSNSGVGFAVPVSTVKFVVPEDPERRQGRARLPRRPQRHLAGSLRRGRRLGRSRRPRRPRRRAAGRQDRLHRRPEGLLLGGRVHGGYRPQAGGTGQSGGGTRRRRGVP